MIQEHFVEKVASERWGSFGHVEKKKKRGFQRELESKCKEVVEGAGRTKTSERQRPGMELSSTISSESGLGKKPKMSTLFPFICKMQRIK